MWHWTIRSVPVSAFSAIFAIFRPLWSQTDAPEEPKFLAKVPFKLQDEHGELYRSEKGAPNIEISSIERSHFSGCVNYMIFGALGGHPNYVCESSSMSGKNLLSILDKPVFNACENMDSTLREKPPMTVTFYENLGRSCNIDEPESNLSIRRDDGVHQHSLPGLPRGPQGQGGSVGVNGR